MSAKSSTHQAKSDIAPVLAFLRCRTPPRWVDAAIADLDTLLLDHAALELKAAQQAQALIYRYGAREWRGRGPWGWRTKSCPGGILTPSKL